jgi:hypothetical protein
MDLVRWVWLAAFIALAGPGCSIAPKTFKKVNDPSAIVRARSVSLGSKLPTQAVVPALIDRLEDKDPVVRLAAYEELKRGTGRSFGYVPWGADSERAGAVSRWRAWWSGRQAALVRVGRNP